MSLTYGSLFSGYGGLDLAVEDVLGARAAWHSEVDRDASTVLAKHWPDVPNLGDVTAIDWTQVEPVDVLCGGFPCQDISSAGRGAGITEGTRSGLWYRYADAVRVLRPRLVFVENVGLLLVRGLDKVLGSLAEIGYDARWLCLRASNVGACHRRERLFLVAWPAADTASGRWNGRQAGEEPALGAGNGVPAERGESLGVVAGSHRPDVFGIYAAAVARHELAFGRPAPDPTDERKRLSPRFVEWMMGLDDGWVTDCGLSRSSQLKRLGNGVVPLQGATALQLLLGLPAATMASEGELLRTPDVASGRRSGDVKLTGRTPSDPQVSLHDQVALLPTPVANDSGNTPEEHLRKKPGRQVVTSLQVLVDHGLLATGGRIPEAAS